MTNAPKQIWAVPEVGQNWSDGLGKFRMLRINNTMAVSYTRTDVYNAVVSERNALRKEVEELGNIIYGIGLSNAADFMLGLK